MVRTTDEIAQAIRELEIVKSVAVISPWRLPSRIWLEERIAIEHQRIEDLPYYFEPAKAEQLTLDCQARLGDFTQQLEAFEPLRSKPIRLRFADRAKIEFSPDDQVVSVSGSTSIYALQKVLAEHGQCLPLPPHHQRRFHGPKGLTAIRHAIDFNLPHPLEAQCGSWRDWILGMTVVLADGTIAKSGSHAVKNVAGYDVHKLMVGARGTLGIIAEVILRTYPIDARPKPELTLNYEWKGFKESTHLMNLPLWLQRTLPSDFRKAVEGAGDRLLEADWASSTLCAKVPPDQELKRFGGDWLLRARCGSKNLSLTDPSQIRLMKRAKEIFDPAGKLNPGEMGIF